MESKIEQRLQRHSQEEAEPLSPITTATSHGREAAKDIACGSVAGMIGKLVEYPFDTVKVRLQSQPDHLPLQYTGPLDCFTKSLQKDGIRGLYRGLGAPMVGAAAENASLFFTYRIAQDFFRRTLYPEQAVGEKLPLGVLAAAGAVAGTATSFVLTPIELVKCRMQVPMQSPVDPTLGPQLGSTGKPLRPLAVIGDVWRRQGLLGFWRGQLGTLLRETGGGVAWFGSYEALTSWYEARARIHSPSKPEISVLQQMSAGAVAGISYNFLFYPADTIKSKMQTGELGAAGRQTFMSTARLLWRAHGLSGLYRGCGLTCARSAPSSALVFTVYEALRKRFE